MLSAAKRFIYHRWNTENITSALVEAQVPYSESPCRDCPDPCDYDTHKPYPTRFKTDQETPLLGTVKPYHKQCLISTGKNDWPHDIAEASDTLAAFLSKVDHKTSVAEEHILKPGRKVVGLHSSSKSSRLSILNGSHHSNSSEDHVETVLVFPDYKMIHVSASLLGASELWNEHLVPSSGGRGGKLPAWLLPYECVVLLCSHKRRDNRCGIASGILSHALQTAFEKKHWEVHTELENADQLGPPLPEGVASLELRKESLQQSRRRVLILSNSHMGGHKFAGNMIIYTAAGAGVWYGRVTTHNVSPIIEETILGGRVLPELLRGGINLGHRQNGSILDW